MGESNHQLYQRILDNLNAAIFMLDKNLYLLYVNPAGEIFFSSSVTRLLGMPVNKLIRHKEMIDEFYLALQHQNHYIERGITLSLQQRTVMVDITVIPMFNTEEQVELLVEITPADHHIKISRENNLSLQNQVTRSVIRGVAHEVKNPLGGIRGAAQLLEAELPDKELKEYTQVIISETDRLTNLVNRMLEPNDIPVKKLVNIHEITEHVRSIVKNQLPNNITLDVDYDPSIPELLLDRDQIVQALLNIVGNARESLDRQQIISKGKIIIQTRIQRNFTINKQYHQLISRINIIDNGKGISEDLLDSIFYPLVTSRPEGTGLGLSISQSVISRHGGLIECESEPGNTVFSIYLPFE